MTCIFEIQNLEGSALCVFGCVQVNFKTFSICNNTIYDFTKLPYNIRRYADAFYVMSKVFKVSIDLFRGDLNKAIITKNRRFVGPKLNKRSTNGL